MREKTLVVKFRAARALHLIEERRVNVTNQQHKRGRPALSDEEAKRSPVTFRTTPDVRDRIVAAAEASGRSIAQEVELRLEQSLARDRAAGSREAAILADFTRLAVSIIEAQTGKSWTQDADTYFRVSKAIRAFMTANHPPATDDMIELDEAVAELQQLGEAMDEQQGVMNALRGEPADPAVIEAHSKALERTQAALERRQEAMHRNDEAGREAAETLGHIFQLAPAKKEAAEQITNKPTHKRASGSKPMPRFTRIEKRQTEPHSTRQRA